MQNVSYTISALQRYTSNLHNAPYPGGICSLSTLEMVLNLSSNQKCGYYIDRDVAAAQILVQP